MGGYSSFICYRGKSAATFVVSIWITLLFFIAAVQRVASLESKAKDQLSLREHLRAGLQRTPLPTCTLDQYCADGKEYRRPTYEPATSPSSGLDSWLNGDAAHDAIADMYAL